MMETNDETANGMQGKRNERARCGGGRAQEVPGQGAGAAGRGGGAEESAKSSGSRASGQAATDGEAGAPVAASSVPHNADFSEAGALARSAPGELAETWYNFARGYHQLGLASQALVCYERALRLLELALFAPPGEGGEGRGGIVPAAALDALLEEDLSAGVRCDQVALLRACAYNLQLVYQASGNYEKARSIVDRYLTV